MEDLAGPAPPGWNCSYLLISCQSRYDADVVSASPSSQVTRLENEISPAFPDVGTTADLRNGGLGNRGTAMYQTTRDGSDQGGGNAANMNSPSLMRTSHFIGVVNCAKRADARHDPVCPDGWISQFQSFDTGRHPRHRHQRLRNLVKQLSGILLFAE